MMLGELMDALYGIPRAHPVARRSFYAHSPQWGEVRVGRVRLCPPPAIAGRDENQRLFKRFARSYVKERSGGLCHADQQPDEQYEQADPVSYRLLGRRDDRPPDPAIFLRRRAEGRLHPLQPVRAAAARRQGVRGRRVRPLPPGQAQRAAGWQERVRHHPGRSAIRRRPAEIRRYLFRGGGQHAAAGPPLLGRSGGAVFRRLDVLVAARGAGVGRRLDVDRQEQGKSLRRIRHRRSLRRRRRRRRSQGRAARDRRVSEKSRAIQPARRPHAERHSAGRAARHRQDAAGEGGRRRGQGAVLLDLRLRVRRDVRRRRRRPRPRSVRAGTIESAGHHLHRRIGRTRPRPRLRGVRRRTTRKSRRSISCWSKWTASMRAAAW